MAHTGDGVVHVVHGLDHEALGDGGLAPGLAVEVHLHGVTAGQDGTQAVDVGVDGLDVLVVGVGGTVGGDDAVGEGLVTAHGGEPGEVGELLVAIGQGHEGLVADLGARGTAEGHGLGHRLEVQARLDVIGQTHVVHTAEVHEEALPRHAVPRQGVGVEIVHDVVQLVARAVAVLAPGVQHALPLIQVRVGGVLEEIQMAEGVGVGLLDGGVGVQEGIGIVGLVLHVVAVDSGDVAPFLHVGSDGGGLLIQKGITEIAVGEDELDAVLVGQLGHFGLLLGVVTAVARAHHEVDTRLGHETVLLVVGMLGIRRPEHRDHDLIVVIVLLLHHVDRAGQGLAPHLGGDGGLTYGLGGEGAVSGDGYGLIVGAGPGHRTRGVQHLDLVGLPHVQLQGRLLQGGVGGEYREGQGGKHGGRQHHDRQDHRQRFFHRGSPFGDNCTLIIATEERIVKRNGPRRRFLTVCTYIKEENCEKSPSPGGEHIFRRRKAFQIINKIPLTRKSTARIPAAMTHTGSWGTVIPLIYARSGRFFW